MADIIDEGNQTADFFLSLALLKKQQHVIKATGECLYCSDEVEPGRRWCNAECRDHWQQENP
jgi:hypothetical protein